jgi:hypothetical protein
MGTKAFALAAALLISTMSLEAPGAEASSSPTPHLDQVVAAIRNMEVATGSDSTQGVLWSVTDGNTLPGLGTKDPAWLIRTQSCWGAQGPCSSEALQRHLLATIRDIVASGVLNP